MDYIDTATKRHAGHRSGRGESTGVTTCGRVVTVLASGACIAPMVDCGRCRSILRKHGWLL